ncbi:uncharacterized protein [Euphorbia lathyris]|uniref:uncharacterized protein n=1 Tax=Euphorbia lathyris TaxID=212925 RepID=UPI003313AD71
MATSTSSSAPNPKFELTKKVRSHEVALAELDNLSSSRAVYQKTGNLFFRTSTQKAKAAEQKQLDSAKAMLAKLNSN